jgi:hypothetical protein
MQLTRFKHEIKNDTENLRSTASFRLRQGRRVAPTGRRRAASLPDNSKRGLRPAFFFSKRKGFVDVPMLPDENPA